MKNFKLREDLSIEVCGVTLFRIEATRDIKQSKVKAGELGGYVEKEENLSGNAWVSGNARVSGNAQVYGDALKSREDCCNIYGQIYNITILPESIQIGCQYHKKEEWFGFSDREIIAMDGKEGLKWWRIWKPILHLMCEAGNALAKEGENDRPIEDTQAARVKELEEILVEILDNAVVNGVYREKAEKILKKAREQK